ncbi:MAG: hypothetical protein D3924_10545, partial [Candidatus Electrothrix sp. AR4]|nr:hypothetical protein [Candidatus Electrothrix sp. AR4]
KQVKIEAEFLRLGLTGGLITTADVIRWADRQIENGEADATVLDLSLSTNSSPGKITTLLAAVPGACERILPLNMLLASCSVLLSEGKMKHRELIAGLGKVIRANKVPEQVRNEIAWLEEQADMADNEGFGSESEARDEVKRYVAAYTQYRSWVPCL